MNLTHAWGQPSGVKLREVNGSEYMIVTDSFDLIAIAPYPDGNRKVWGLEVGLSPHAAELLPDGNIAMALSASLGWIRIYTTSKDSNSNQYCDYMLKGAHSVLWDPIKELLWALNKSHCFA